MILPILIWPNRVLHQVSAPVNAFASDLDVNQLVADLFESMYDARGIGLAAVQVGVLARVFVVDVTRPLVFINPTIQAFDGDQRQMDEGCLSIPGVFEKVLRYPIVTVEDIDIKGNRRTNTFYDLEAQVIAHETEHLDGIVMPDKLSPLRRARVAAKMAKYKKPL